MQFLPCAQAAAGTRNEGSKHTGRGFLKPELSMYLPPALAIQLRASATKLSLAGPAAYAPRDVQKQAQHVEVMGTGADGTGEEGGDACCGCAQ